MSRYRYRNSYPPYVSSAEKQKRNKQMVAKLSHAGRILQPVVIKGRTIASSFWGKAWCKNVESYQDYANRLPRGRSYVRDGAVVDLQIFTGKVTALVTGSSSHPYEIFIDIKPLARERWEALKQRCLGKISSLLSLVQGKLPQEILAEFCDRDTGLFPSAEEIKMSCTCPDWAELCKHLSAVLYGIGARLDEDPKLFFVLRGIQESELVGSEVIDSLTDGVSPEIDSDNLATVFDLELDSLEEIMPAKNTATKTPMVPARKEIRLDQTPWTAEKIIALRKQLGLTQAKLGQCCNVTGALVSSWECGKTPVSKRCWESLNGLLPENIKPAEKAIRKPAEKAIRKPAEKAIRKPAEKAIRKPAEKAIFWDSAQIKQLRQQLGLTQAALGALCNVTAPMISHWERGSMPIAQRFWQTLDVLRVENQQAQPKNDLPETTATDILQIRRRHALSRAALGKQLGVSAYLISKWEKTGDIPGRIKRKLARM